MEGERNVGVMRFFVSWVWDGVFATDCTVVAWEGEEEEEEGWNVDVESKVGVMGVVRFLGCEEVFVGCWDGGGVFECKQMGLGSCSGGVPDELHVVGLGSCEERDGGLEMVEDKRVGGRMLRRFALVRSIAL